MPRYLATLIVLASMSSNFAAEQSADSLQGTVDPYIPGQQRSLFLRDAGVDSELNAAEFAKSVKAEDGFLQSFDAWDAIKLFDKNKDNTIDWFEADAYRRALKAVLLRLHDKNADRRLLGDERTAAMKSLADGHLVSLLSKSQVGSTREGIRGDADRAIPLDRKTSSTKGQKTSGLPKETLERLRTAIRKHDKDGDGKLSAAERAAANETRYVGIWKDRRDAWVKSHDRNGDGRVDREEHLAAIKKVRAAQQAEYQQKVRQFDNDGDGKLSPEKWRRARQQTDTQCCGNSQTPQGTRHSDVQHR